MQASGQKFGLGKGAIYPAEHARALLNPARRLIQSPRRVVGIASIADGTKLLELGCGPGWFSPELARAVGSGTVTYFDLQPAMLHFARARTGSARQTAGDAQRLPFRAEAFDAVFLSAVLGEVPDPARVWRELARVLPVGGTAIFVETRTDPDFQRYERLLTAAHSAGFTPRRCHRGFFGYVATFAKV
jgi:ubiquinone/menaquinone biosynthesis C-methylase UbiE